MPVSRAESRNDAADVQLEYQQELETLERHYRKMKTEKKSYKVETDNILRRQEFEIEKLAKEHQDIEALLSVSVSRYNTDFDKGNVKKLNNLLEKDLFVQAASWEGKHALAMLDKRIIATKEEVLKKKLCGKNAQSLDQFAVERNNRIMENRVYNANMRFNKTLTKNAKLKGTIDYISVQKMRFRELYRRLRREFQNGKTEIDNIVESSLNHFHARDEAQHRMAFLREKAERDLSLYNMELKDVMRIIDHDRKLRNFMSTKTENRSVILEQAIFKRQNKRMTNLLGNLKVETSKYEEIFSKIREVTGIHDIDELVSRFIKIEDENFAQFNYVNEVNTEIEALQEIIREKTADMADMAKTSTQIDKRRREILGQLEVRYSDVCTKRQRLQEQYKQAKKVLEKVKPKIDILFKSIKCNRSAITDLLGNTAGLTDDNVMSFLGIIEQRTNEMLQVQCLQRIRYGLDDANKHLMATDATFPTTTERCPPFSIKPPSIADDDEIAGGQMSDFPDSQPVSFKEAKALVNKGPVCVREVTKVIRSSI